MKFSRSDLDRGESSRVVIQGSSDIDINRIIDHPRCTDLREVFVEGIGYYDQAEGRFIVDVEADGIMVVPCAITLRPVELEFVTRFSEVFSFEKLSDEEDGIEVDGDELDLDSFITDAILAEIPLKVVHPDVQDYPEGDGWQVLKEEEFLEKRSQEIDPRLAKLKDFKFE